MTMSDQKWLGREGGNWRGWVISLLTVLVAALLVAAIAEVSQRSLSPTVTEGSSHWEGH